MEYLLKSEIQIVRPKKIFCTGSKAHEFLKKLCADEIKGTELIPLTHYSRRANLPLDIKDKMNIIWKMEAGILSKQQVRQMHLSDLSHFGEDDHS